MIEIGIWRRLREQSDYVISNYIHQQRQSLYCHSLCKHSFRQQQPAPSACRCHSAIAPPAMDQRCSVLSGEAAPAGWHAPMRWSTGSVGAAGSCGAGRAHEAQHAVLQWRLPRQRVVLHCALLKVGVRKPLVLLQVQWAAEPSRGAHGQERGHLPGRPTGTWKVWLICCLRAASALCMEILASALRMIPCRSRRTQAHSRRQPVSASHSSPDRPAAAG